MARKRRSRVRRRGIFLQALVLLAIGAALALFVFPKSAPHRGAQRTITSRISTPAAATIQPSPALTDAPHLSPSPASAQSPAASAATASAPAAARPRVAIIIDDCGQWPAIERGYIGLPIALTMSVMPHVRFTAGIAEAAAAAGKGVMLHLPMEPLSHVNPGAGKITLAMSDAEIIAQTKDDLAQVPLAKGLNNHEGSAASADPRVMRDVVGVIKDRGLFFVDSRTSAASVGAQTATAGGVPTASRDVFLDNKEDVAYSESMLEQTVRIAKQRGSAIAIGHPRATTLEALTHLYAKMQAEGVDFVLVSDLTH